MTPHDDGLVCAYTLGPTVARLSWQDLAEPIANHHWVHLDRAAKDAQQWLKDHAALPPLIQQALLTTETRPRLVFEPSGMLLILRGVNLNPGADPEDMVSIRIWLDKNRIISSRNRPLQAVKQLRDTFEQGQGLPDPGAVVVGIVRGLIQRMGPVIEEIDEQLDELEEQLISSPSAAFRSQLSGLRRQTVALRRYLAPQREVLHRLAQDSGEWISTADRAALRETADQITRHVEDLDALRERAVVTQEELIARLQDGMNANMYRLSVVTAIFLPLGFLTGLLGINVGGMPGVDAPQAFWVVCGLLLGVIAFELWIVYRRRWL